jgi:hypothetical protein
MSNIFELASRKKYRFESDKGLLSVEQIWDLPLTQLNKIAISVNKNLKDVTEESFIDIRPNPEKSSLEAKLEILKHVISVKQDEQKAAKDAADKKARKQKILQILENKKNEQLTEMSEEELMKQLESL